ncbi:MAG: hypothetical protein M1818_005091 [Claussenomyces sp. TS43310]|nr:MAG: hypothetical protein M1818_005091 [Claussenomyces sp. TS43310]
MTNLQEIDSLEALVIVDNELDPISWAAPNTVTADGNLVDVGMRSKSEIHGREPATKELRMDQICCAAHGLSIMLTATRGDVNHTILFDAGPEGEVWERNAARLAVDLSAIEVIQLSHWHRDHSGGMLKALELINAAKADKGISRRGISVDLHSDRPDYRGIQAGLITLSLEADPTFAEIEATGATITRSSEGHTVLDNMFLISGEIPRQTTYETGLKNGIRFSNDTKIWTTDELIKDERFLMCNLKGKGIVVFTGCSHAGVVNTSRNAVELLSKVVPLHAVVGGFHLASSDDEGTRAAVQGLKALGPRVLLPGHCTGWRAKFEIERDMPGRLVPCTVGTRYAF